jgi:hypothetical protein
MKYIKCGYLLGNGSKLPDFLIKYGDKITIEQDSEKDITYMMTDIKNGNMFFQRTLLRSLEHAGTLNIFGEEGIIKVKKQNGNIYFIPNYFVELAQYDNTWSFYIQYNFAATKDFIHKKHFVYFRLRKLVSGGFYDTKEEEEQAFKTMILSFNEKGLIRRWTEPSKK